MAAARTTLTTVLAMNNTKFKRGIDGSKKSLTGFQKQVGSMKGQLAGAFAVAGIAAFTKSSIRALDFQIKAQTKVAQAIKSTGGTAGFAAEELNKLAKSLQKVTLFGDEQILSGVTAQLLTFTNIVGREFKRTQKVVLDVATVLEQDLKSTAIQLGKALNDPVANLGALGRSGIQFSKKQKVLIKSLWEVGRQAEAQAVILKELEKQYGGQAEAAATADVSLTQLKNRFGDFKESAAGFIIAATKSTTALKDLWAATTSHDIAFMDRVLGLFSPAKAAEIAAVAGALKEIRELTPGGTEGFFGKDNSKKIVDGGEEILKTQEEIFKAWEKINDKIRERIELQEDLNDSMRDGLQAHIDGILEANKKKVGIAPSFMFGDDGEDTTGMGDAASSAIAQAEIKFQDMKKRMEELRNEMNFALENFAAEGLTNLFATLGESLATKNFENFFADILGMFGNFMVQMGGMIIAYGIAMEAFKQAFANPFAAIAAGIALAAIGGAIIGAATNMRSKGSSASNGGFIPNNQGNVGVNFRIAGNDLVGVLERNSTKVKRFT